MDDDGSSLSFLGYPLWLDRVRFIRITEFNSRSDLYIACYIWHTIRTVTFDGVWSTDQIVNLELSYMSITVLTNIFCTTAIVYRIVVVSGWRKSFKTYHRLMEILIESSVLYTAVYAIRIGLQIHAQYFTEEHDQRMYFAQALGYSTFTVGTLVPDKHDC